MNFSQFVEWAFLAVISGGIAFGVSILRKMSVSISELNIHVARLLERSDAQSKQIERHDERIGRLEETNLIGGKYGH